MFLLRPLGDLLEVEIPGAEPGAVRRWVAKNGPALFDVVLARRPFPSGWVLLTGRLLQRDADTSAKLYYDLGSGFSENQFVSPSISRKGTIHELVWLPHGVQALRWQATDSAGEFEQSQLHITPVTWAGRVARMLRRAVSTLTSQRPGRCRAVGLTTWRILTDLQSAYVAAGKLRGYSRISYREWIERYDTSSERDRLDVRQHIKQFKFRPRLAVVIQVRTGSDPELSASLRALADQLYQDFSVVLVDRSGLLDKFDPGPVLRDRVHVVRGEPTLARLEELWGKADQRGAGQEARFIALVGEGDSLAEHALYWILAELQRCPQAALLYSDSDWMDADGTRTNPCFKPDWSPELLRSTNYLGGLVVYRLDTLFRGDDMDANFLSVDTHDLALRMAERASPEEVVHVPAVLYHRGFRVGDAHPESSIEAVRAHWRD
jgi:hypothetical protein